MHIAHLRWQAQLLTNSLRHHSTSQSLLSPLRMQRFIAQIATLTVVQTEMMKGRELYKHTAESALSGLKKVQG